MRFDKMIKRLFKRNEQENFILEGYGNLAVEIYDHLNSIVQLDKNGNIVSCNQAFIEQFGYAEQDFNKPFLDILLKDNSLEIKKYFENATFGKKEKFSTIGYLKKGNKEIDINITLIPINNKDTIDVFVIISDITKFQKQKKEIDQFEKMREAFDEVDYICNFYYDAINDYFYFSKQINDMLQINPEKPFTPSFKHLLRYVHPDDVERLENAMQTALKERVPFQIEYRMIRKDQTTFIVRIQTGIYLDQKGNLDGIVGFIQDITDFKISRDLLEKEKQIKILYDNPDVGIWSQDVQKGEYIDISNGIEYITGYTKNDFNNGLQWDSIIQKEDLQQFLDKRLNLAKGKIIHHQYRIVDKNGAIKWVQDYTIPSLDDEGNIVRLDGITSDITEQKEMEEKIKYLANYDSLTQLPNRNKFIDKVEQLIDEYENSNHQFALLKLDIDGFKYVNNTLGSEFGDEVLKQIPKRISKYLTPNDMIARRGGDEFEILIDKIQSISELKMRVTKIMECLNNPFNIKGYEIYITVSIGISTYPGNGVTSIELTRNAILALHNAEKRGKNNYYILSNYNSIQSFKNYSIGRDLKKAIGDKEMVLYFQPRVDANTNQIIGAEALIRWNHHEWGLISPAEFLTIAEENGLITEMDDWVLNEVCNQIRNWRNMGMFVVPISINISATNFLKSNWTNKVATIIREIGIQPHDIEFEITESTIFNDSVTVKNSILKLKELGIKIALDDFGTGYSSLSYLTHYPFDLIKIDKSFMRNMIHSKRDLHLTKSIIYMAKGLQLRIIAEGVETIQQLKMLQQEQCDEIQGYLFSKPVPVNEFEVLLQKKVLIPIDPNQKEAQNRRKHYRLNFPIRLEADMMLVSIAGRTMELEVSKVLIENIGVGGLRFISNLKLPIRGDVLYQFKTELLEESVTLNGTIVWKEEINEDLMEYGIKFTIEEEEQASLSTLLNSFIVLLKSSTNLPPYRKSDVDKYQYFK